MKNVMKVIVSLVIILIFIVVGLFIRTGLSIYDVALDAHSDVDVFEILDMDTSKTEKNREWLDNNALEETMESEDGLLLHSYRMNVAESNDYVILVHGYRSEGAALTSVARKMVENGYNVLLPDLRGHGQSEGDYIGLGWDDRNDIIQWINRLIVENPSNRIFLYGVSMGGATVMNVSGESLPPQVKAIVEDCGYTNVWDIIQDNLEMSELESEIALNFSNIITKIKAGYFISDSKPIEQVAKSDLPILFIHGTDDEVVPFFMLDELYKAKQGEKEILVVEGAKHTEAVTQEPEIYYQTVFDFFDKYKDDELSFPN